MWVGDLVDVAVSVYSCVIFFYVLLFVDLFGKMFLYNTTKMYPCCIEVAKNMSLFHYDTVLYSFMHQ